MTRLLECLAVIAWVSTPFTCVPIVLGTVRAALDAPNAVWTASLDDPVSVLWAATTLLALMATVTYAVWFALDHKTPFRGGADRGRAIRASKIMQWWRRYFPVHLVTTAPLPPGRNYILAVHPHGLYSFGSFANFVAGIGHEEATKHKAPPHASPFHVAFPHIQLRLATLRFNFWCPLWREVNTIYGFLSVDFKSCLHWLTNGGTFTAQSTVTEQVTVAALKLDRVEHRERLDSGISLTSVTHLRERTRAKATAKPGGDSEDIDEGVVAGSDESILTDRAIPRSPTPPSEISDDSGISTGSESSRSSAGESRALLICVGGAEESLLTQPGCVELVLHKRKGFVRLALTSGASLVPVFTFNETDIYRSYRPHPKSWFARFQQTMKRYVSWTVPVVYGRLGMWLPYRHPVTTVIGAPIHVPRVEKPSRELVEHFHAIYIDQLTRLWREHAERHPHRETGKISELKIVA